MDWHGLVQGSKAWQARCRHETLISRAALQLTTPSASVVALKRVRDLVSEGYFAEMHDIGSHRPAAASAANKVALDKLISHDWFVVLGLSRQVTS